MKRFLSLAMCLFLVASLTSAVLAKDTRATGSSRYSGVDMAVNGDNVVLTSSGSLGSFKAAGTDTFCLYGGPGSVLGKFQAALPPGDTFTSDSQSWYHKDVTDQPTLWQLGTFNSPTGTQCMWAGQTNAQQPGWATAPGYGNSWNALLSFTTTVSDPSQPQTVGLDFTFNHDSEGGYDYFDVEYDSNGTNVLVYHRDGNNRSSPAGPFVPLSYASAGGTTPIVHAANTYNGLGGNEIRIRLAARSDGAWSDEDGLNPSDGLAQVDNIQVTTLDGAGPVEDFDVGPFLWNPEKAPFAGDFSDTFTGMSDIDPCRDNNTGVIGFIDDGDGPYNPTYFGTGTGGTTSDNWSTTYGITGGWVVNYNGGLSAGSLDLDNEWWSPEIAWDVDAGVTDASDDNEVAGALIRMSIWRHLPLLNGMFYQWSVRGHETGGNWSAWDNRNFVYYGNDGDWINISPVVSDLLPAIKDKVQMQFAVRDLAALFAFAGTDATPSPTGDNMAFLKFRLGGPVFATRAIDLFQDSFAQSGATDVSTSVLRDAHDVRIDMARDVNTGVVNNVPGDSIIFDVTSVIPFVALSDSLNQISMHYSLNKNPVFEDAIRNAAIPAGMTAVNSVGTGMFGWDQVEGTVAALQTYTSAGAPIGDRYNFDLPDADWMYPGDVLEYYIRAVDDALNATTIPANIAGFDDTTANFSRTYTMRALPTYTGTDGDHPDILFWNDFGRRGGEAEALAAFNQNGLYEGVHFDSYTTQGPSSLVSNGLGSSGAHGATSDQLSGYACIITEHGDLSAGLISDGTNAASDDKGDDAGVLQGWYDASGANRAIAHFGDNLATMLALPTSANTYLSGVMNTSWVAKDVRPTIGNQIAPLVSPSGAVGAFGTDFIAYGGCLLINQFDQVNPGGGAVVGHNFMDAGGSVALGNASIYNTTTDTDGGVKQSLFFPYGLLYVYHPTSKVAAGASARAALLEEILNLFGGAHLPAPGPAVGSPSALSLAAEQPYPNPFNPKTTISFALGQAGRASVKIYNVRGALVRVLADREFPAGRSTLDWNGRDDRGATVASGVYTFKIAGNNEELVRKAVLIK